MRQPPRGSAPTAPLARLGRPNRSAAGPHIPRSRSTAGHLDSSPLSGFFGPLEECLGASRRRFEVGLGEVFGPALRAARGGALGCDARQGRMDHAGQPLRRRAGCVRPGRGRRRRRRGVHLDALRRGELPGPGPGALSRRRPERRTDPLAGRGGRVRAQVAVDADGDAVFTWRRSDGTDYRVQARMRSAAGALSAVQTLSASGQSAVTPQVAIDPDGDAVFTWWRSDGANLRVQARARSAAGALSGVQTLSGRMRGPPGRGRRRRRRGLHLVALRRDEHPGPGTGALRRRHAERGADALRPGRTRSTPRSGSKPTATRSSPGSAATGRTTGSRPGRAQPPGR